MSVLQILRTLLIESRRILSIAFMPWIGVIFFCLAASLAVVYFLDIPALIAPIIKSWYLVKTFFVKTLPAWFALPWLKFSSKLVGAATVAVGFLLSLLGGWKAWSVKKLARQSIRFIASQSAKFVASSVMVSLLLGRERKSLKGLPGLIRRRLTKSVLGRFVKWWADTSERNKRLAAGLILCLILAIVGHALIGISILLFDLIWELVLILSRWFHRGWSLLWPMIRREMPEAVVNFVTRKLLPLIANAIPAIRDDHRVMYTRFNLRLHYRRIKYLLHRYARAHRPRVRASITPLISPRLRQHTDTLLDKAVELVESESGKEKKGE